jgi:hypothetical protein
MQSRYAAAAPLDQPDFELFPAANSGQSAFRGALQ